MKPPKLPKGYEHFIIFRASKTRIGVRLMTVDRTLNDRMLQSGGLLPFA